VISNRQVFQAEFTGGLRYVIDILQAVCGDRVDVQITLDIIDTDQYWQLMV
jgi:hypothetical protein